LRPSRRLGARTNRQAGCAAACVPFVWTGFAVSRTL
jgi:hypothetical protein